MNITTKHHKLRFDKYMEQEKRDNLFKRGPHDQKPRIDMERDSSKKAWEGCLFK